MVPINFQLSDLQLQVLPVHHQVEARSHPVRTPRRLAVDSLITAYCVIKRHIVPYVKLVLVQPCVLVVFGQVFF